MTLLLLSGCVCCKRTATGTAPEPPAASPPATTVSPQPTTAVPASPGEPTALFSPATFALIAGVLSFESPSLAPFSTAQRKDQELYDTLHKRGVPEANMELLLDRDVTAIRVKSALERLAKRAPAGSTLFFYYAGHGMRDREGEPYFAAYDTGDDLPGSAIAISALKSIVASHFHGSRLLLMGDCCYSGALRSIADELATKGLATISLTSADASNVSTSNWTFTQTVIDAMNGDPLCDHDQNGTLTLSELETEVAAAMKFREMQRHGFVSHNVPANLVLTRSAGSRANSAGPFSAGQYVEANHGGRSTTARIIEGGVDRSLVQFYRYSEKLDARVANSELRPMQFKRFAPAKAVRVFWGGKIWDANIIETDGDFHKITYPGWPDYWDEWILSNRIVDDALPGRPRPEGERVSVEWHGSWYPAIILKHTGSRYLIHYEGYDASWDEWVTRARIRDR